MTEERDLGSALIGAGVIALAVSIWQYRWTIRYLGAEPFDRLAGVREGGMRTPILAVSVALMLIGLFAFVLTRAL